jgi:hypothetical protein
MNDKQLPFFGKRLSLQKRNTDIDVVIFEVCLKIFFFLEIIWRKFNLSINYSVT